MKQENKEENFSGLKVTSFESRRAYEMQSLLERHGGKALVAPSMREIPFELNQEALEFGKKVVQGKADIVILMTGVGARFLLQVIEKAIPRETFLASFAKTVLVARGPKPVLALKEMGITPAISAPEPNTWREVLAALDQKILIKEKKVFVQEYGIQNQEFIKQLKKRGAHVSRVPVYRWALPEDLSLLKKAIFDVCDGNTDILLFTNATQIYNVLEVAGEEGLETSFREALDQIVVGSIGPIVSENLKESGLPIDFESKDSKMGLFVKEASLVCPALLEQKRKAWQKDHKKIEIKIVPIKPYNGDLCKESAFMKACCLEPACYTPIWIMRQAGRYMKEYRELRSKVKFLDLCKNSDLACEVTVTAQEKLGVDAAILFSDILLILEPMGVGLEYAKGDGPLIYRPVRTAEAVENLPMVVPEESLGFVFEAIKKIRSELNPKIPLIGFAGAPFTVVSYMVEGKSSENYLHTKSFMYRDYKVWNQLMSKVTESTIAYILGQIKAGAQAVQVFDSWVGCLSPRDYKTFVFPHMKRLFSSLPLSTPVIHFGTDTGALLELMRDAGGQVIGLDWRVELGKSWDQLGSVAVQGNLDPMVLLSDHKTIREQTKRILEEAKSRNGHIFNLGHGVLPQTPVENVRALVEMVHEMSSR